MKSADILKDPTIEWAVVNPSRSAPRSDRKANDVPREKTLRVKLYDTRYYHKASYIRPEYDPLYHSLAPSTERSKGFLVKDSTSGNMYILSASEFLGAWDVCVDEWDAKALKKELEAAEASRRSAIRAEQDATIRATIPTIEANLKSSTAKILGPDVRVTAYLSHEGVWDTDFTKYTPKIVGNVTLTVADYQRLLEKLYEAREANN